MESGTARFSRRQIRGVDAPTLTEALGRTAADHGDVIAVRTIDDSVSLTWSQLLERVEDLAGGLAKLGVGRGDKVAIMIVQPPGVPHRRPRGGRARCDAVLDLQHPAGRGGRVPLSRRRLRRSSSASTCTSPRSARSRKYVSGDRARDRDRRPCTTRTSSSSRRSRPQQPGLRRQGCRPGRSVPTMSLTLIYTSGTTGKPKGGAAFASQRHDGLQRSIRRSSRCARESR